MTKVELLDIGQGWGGSKTTLSKSTTPEFRKKLVCIADSLGLDPSYMAAVMLLESRFDPKAKYSATNPKTKVKRTVAVGLIQFTNAAVPLVEAKLTEIEQMDAMQQLDLVDKFFAAAPKSKLKTVGDYYMATFMPGFVGKSASTVIFRESNDRKPGTNGPKDNGFEPYRMNKAFDTNKDGTITVGEVHSKIEPVIRAAKKHPPVVVNYDRSHHPSSPDPTDPLSHSPPSSQLKTLAAVGTVLGLGGAGLYYWLKKNEVKQR